MTATYPTRRGVIWKSAGSEGTVVYEADTDGLHILNASALAIWELCDGKTSPEEMVEAISELTGLGLEVAARDVRTTLETLGRLGLIVD